MERLIDLHGLNQPASYLTSEIRPDYVSRLRAESVCTRFMLLLTRPADGHFDKSSQLEADVIMVYPETGLPGVPNREVVSFNGFLSPCAAVFVQPSQTYK